MVGSWDSTCTVRAMKIELSSLTMLSHALCAFNKELICHGIRLKSMSDYIDERVVLISFRCIHVASPVAGYGLYMTAPSEPEHPY